MQAKLVAIILAAFAAACASPERAVYAELEIRSETREALAAWNRALERACPAVRLELIEDRNAADISVSLGYAPGPLAGAERGGSIVIDFEKAESFPETVPAVVAHELGHALGAEHSSEPGDLMFAPVAEGRSPEPTAADARQACAAWGE